MSRLETSRKRHRCGKPVLYAVVLEPSGRVLVDRAGAVNPREWVATITHATDPDWLGEEIAHEWSLRNA
jgi:hypothetical protein